MRDLTAIRERYLRDELPVRLGGLAANLARIKSFSDHPNHCDVIESLLNESKFFIEEISIHPDRETILSSLLRFTGAGLRAPLPGKGEPS